MELAEIIRAIVQKKLSGLSRSDQIHWFEKALGCSYMDADRFIAARRNTAKQFNNSRRLISLCRDLGIDPEGSSDMKSKVAEAEEGSKGYVRQDAYKTLGKSKAKGPRRRKKKAAGLILPSGDDE